MMSAYRDIHVRPRAHGQAMIEFVVAILLVVILVAGILQFVELAGLKGALLAEIRGETGRRALGLLPATADRPEYIRDWTAGPDGIRHTADDPFERGSAVGTLQQAVVDQSTAAPGDWRFLADARNRDLLRLRESASPVGALGLIHGETREEVALLPVMRDWLLGRDHVTVGCELWFPRLRLEGFD